MLKKSDKDCFMLGHRQRVFQKFEKSGFLGWHDYEILEMALFYTIPVRDTKEIAKILLKEFGSINGVLNADKKALIEMKGIGASTLIFLKFLRELFLKLSEQNLRENFSNSDDKLGIITSTESAYNFLKFLIGANKDEEFVIIFLNNRNCVINYETLSRGTIDEVAVYPRKLIERVLHNNAAGIILAHNHPSGQLNPSDADKQMTINFQNILGAIEVQLLDHLVVSKDGCFSFREHGLLD